MDEIPNPGPHWRLIGVKPALCGADVTAISGSAFLEALIQYGLMPENQDEARLIAEKDPYPLRKRTLDEALTPYEIGRALFHLNQRRGFKSNRKAERTAKDAEDGKIATGAKALDAAMKDANARTLCECLSGLPVKWVRLNGENQSYDFYPQRRLYEEVNNLSIVVPDEANRPLTLDQRYLLIRILQDKKKVSFDNVEWFPTRGLALQRSWANRNQRLGKYAALMLDSFPAALIYWRTRDMTPIGSTRYSNSAVSHLASHQIALFTTA